MEKKYNHIEPSVLFDMALCVDSFHHAHEADRTGGDSYADFQACMEACERYLTCFPDWDDDLYMEHIEYLAHQHLCRQWMVPCDEWAPLLLDSAPGKALERAWQCWGERLTLADYELWNHLCAKAGRDVSFDDFLAVRKVAHDAGEHDVDAMLCLLAQSFEEVARRLHPGSLVCTENGNAVVIACGEGGVILYEEQGYRACFNVLIVPRTGKLLWSNSVVFSPKPCNPVAALRNATIALRNAATVKFSE